MEKSNNLAVIILAAGESKRLGQAKQLLKINKESLLQLAVKKALSLSSDVRVILGGNKQECIEEIKGFDLKYIYNEEYKSGMASSLKKAISSLEVKKDILIMLCDMPLVPLKHYEDLIELYLEDKNTIVSSKYKDSFFVPAIFPKKFLPLFEQLQGDKGARKILKENFVKFVNLEEKYTLDVDTKEDYNRVLATYSC